MDLLDPFWKEQDMGCEQADLHGASVVWSVVMSLAAFAGFIIL